MLLMCNLQIKEWMLLHFKYWRKEIEVTRNVWSSQTQLVEEDDMRRCLLLATGAVDAHF